MSPAAGLGDGNVTVCLVCGGWSGVTAWSADHRRATGHDGGYQRIARRSVDDVVVVECSDWRSHPMWRPDALVWRADAGSRCPRRHRLIADVGQPSGSRLSPGGAS